MIAVELVGLVAYWAVVLFLAFGVVLCVATLVDLFTHRGGERR